MSGANVLSAPSLHEAIVYQLLLTALRDHDFTAAHKLTSVLALRIQRRSTHVDALVAQGAVEVAMRQQEGSSRYAPDVMDRLQQLMPKEQEHYVLQKALLAVTEGRLRDAQQELARHRDMNKSGLYSGYHGLLLMENDPPRARQYLLEAITKFAREDRKEIDIFVYNYFELLKEYDVDEVTKEDMMHDFLEQQSAWRPDSLCLHRLWLHFLRKWHPENFDDLEHHRSAILQLDPFAAVDLDDYAVPLREAVRECARMIDYRHADAQLWTVLCDLLRQAEGEEQPWRDWIDEHVQWWPRVLFAPVQARGRVSNELIVARGTIAPFVLSRSDALWYLYHARIALSTRRRADLVAALNDAVGVEWQGAPPDNDTEAAGNETEGFVSTEQSGEGGSSSGQEDESGTRSPSREDDPYDRSSYAESPSQRSSSVPVL